MQKNLTSLRWLLVLWLAVFSSCEYLNDDPVPMDPQPSGKDLFVTAELVGTVPAATLKSLATAAGFESFAPFAKYDVTFYRMVYKVNYQGQNVQASGLLGIPQGTPAPPALLSAQHGTTFLQAEAPSNFPATFSGFELFASTGFVTVIPDFIGYGTSRNIFHPYFDRKSSALTVVNMLKAAQYFLKSGGIALNKNLFLAGYSEGGYVTMAAQQEIETHPGHQLTLTAAAAGAGGYDLPEFLNQVATVPTYASPSFLAFILQAYNTTYTWNRPLTDFFQQPYAGKIPMLLDGTKNIDQINAELTTNLASLFNPTFYANLKNPSGEPALRQKLLENSFNNWVPRSPTRLYHGTNDESVFFSTSVTTYARFQAAGATNVAFFPIPGGTHRTSIVPMMLNALPWLQSLDK
ncbi:alpha/beta hydrolase family protein [Hymenobacter sp. GOD-10R]|uniref:alpha/beta hydrolase family protein n=1 Tax=Hymenobacter sp. GOD-10R TaxID=3093922 RepID=UPI002D7932A2|nr:lipase family protein [Hymenobacter sp. GOD-10R]WRQ28690.1 lipase family protein [Hymenobacter sp. GOD-10R]